MPKNFKMKTFSSLKAKEIIAYNQISKNVDPIISGLYETEIRKIQISNMKDNLS
jgi:hypothetical protein